MTLRHSSALFFAVLVFGPVFTHAADVMFEGYYRVKLEGKPIGYNILRYEFDGKKQEFNSVSFLRVTIGGQTIQESLKATSDAKMQPVGYQYSSQVDKELKTIDATFKGDVMKVVEGDGGKTNKLKNLTYKIPKDTILSSFLVYYLMQKKNLKPGELHPYSAVAEEEGASYYGKAQIRSVTKRGGQVVLQVKNEFKGERFDSELVAVPDPEHPGQFMRGEVFSSLSPAKNLSTQLMATPALATEGQTLPNKVLATVFGGIPSGRVNMVSTPPKAAVASDEGEEVTPMPAAGAKIKSSTPLATGTKAVNPSATNPSKSDAEE